MYEALHNAEQEIRIHSILNFFGVRLNRWVSCVWVIMTHVSAKYCKWMLIFFPPKALVWGSPSSWAVDNQFNEAADLYWCSPVSLFKVQVPTRYSVLEFPKTHYMVTYNNPCRPFLWTVSLSCFWVESNTTQFHHWATADLFYPQ